MGSRTSTRWNGHKKAKLVEDAMAIDLVALRRSGALAEPEATFDLTWTAGGEVVVSFGIRNFERSGMPFSCRSTSTVKITGPRGGVMAIL